MTGRNIFFPTMVTDTDVEVKDGTISGCTGAGEELKTDVLNKHDGTGMLSRCKKTKSYFVSKVRMRTVYYFVQLSVELFKLQI